MRAIDIALKDLTRSFRSAFAVVFMFVLPLMITGMFYLMFGSSAGGGYSLPRTAVVVANLDQGGPHFQASAKNVPGGSAARTMGELVVNVLNSDELADLIQVSSVPSAEAAHAAVDGRSAQVAIVIPPDFSRRFADPDQQASIEFYQDPTLTIGPDIIRAILNQFMDGMAGVKIAINVFLDEADPTDYGQTGQVIQAYLDNSLVQREDLSGALLDVEERSPVPASKRQQDLILFIVGPIMGGMLVFYAFFTGAYTGQSILKEEEERTLPRLFTTPTPQSVILTGKFLSILLTVLVQVTVLLVAARLIFHVQWGALGPVALVAAGTVLSASAFGICTNSFLKNAKMAGSVFGGLLTITGMLGMIRIFALNSPTGALLGNTVSLLAPQGWAVRGLLETLNGATVGQVAPTVLGMVGWAVALFVIGVWRFNKRYA